MAHVIYGEQREVLSVSEPPDNQIHLTVPGTQAAQWIQEQLDVGRQLNASTRYGSTGASVTAAINAGSRWLDVVRQVLRRIVDRPDIADEWRGAHFNIDDSERVTINRARIFRRLRSDYVGKLEGVLMMLPYIEEALPSQASLQASISEGAEREIFIVHGHDNEAKETVARFLDKLDLAPIILHEQPNEGRTLLEKFEYNAAVGFAVVLLTPDHVGAPKGSAKQVASLARPNAILELGFFFRRFG